MRIAFTATKGVQATSKRNPKKEDQYQKLDGKSIPARSFSIARKTRFQSYAIPQIKRGIATKNKIKFDLIDNWS